MANSFTPVRFIPSTRPPAPPGTRDRALLQFLMVRYGPTPVAGMQDESGAYGIRTRDLLNAIEALYQLS
jgi:hypothetical protein